MRTNPSESSSSQDIKRREEGPEKHSKETKEFEPKKKKKDPEEGSEQAMEQVQQRFPGPASSELHRTQTVQATTALNPAQDVYKALIKEVVSNLQVGKTREADFATMGLNANVKIPREFQNGTVNIRIEGNQVFLELRVQSDQMVAAEALIKSKENAQQLSEFVNNLNGKHLLLAEMRIGNTVIRPDIEQQTGKVKPIAVATEIGKQSSRQSGTRDQPEPVQEKREPGRNS